MKNEKLMFVRDRHQTFSGNIGIVPNMWETARLIPKLIAKYFGSNVTVPE